MDDLTAIKKCRAGETEAYNYLVKKYQSQAIAHAAAILGSHEDALDAVQDAFLDAYRSLRRFDVSRSFYPWLYAILRNRCFDRLASRRKQPATGLDNPDILARAENDSSAEPVESLQKALYQISAEDRELLTLKYLDGLRYGEIAERLKIPAGTVMSRLYYARRRFREKFDLLVRQSDSEEMNDEQRLL